MASNTLKKSLITSGLIQPTDIDVSFDRFPYYLGEKTKNLLKSSAFIPLKSSKFSNFTSKIATLRPKILLCGPSGSGTYQEVLTKALAKHFNVKVLVFDARSAPVFNSDGHDVPRHDAFSKLGPLPVDLLLEVVNSESQKGPLIFFIKHIETLILSGTFEMPESLSSLLTFLNQLPANVVAISSYVEKKEDDKNETQTREATSALPKLSESVRKILAGLKEQTKIDQSILQCFPNRIPIEVPTSGEAAIKWEEQKKNDIKALKSRESILHLRTVLYDNNLECKDLHEISVAGFDLTHSATQKVVAWALNYELMNAPLVYSESQKICISGKSLMYALKLWEGSRNDTIPDTPKKISLGDIEIDNEYEKKLLKNVIVANDIGVSFDQVGALDDVKRSLQEVVMLPLQRPELFTRGNLTKPCKGILLFGPPGTGKTMLAKAIATEAGANFLNISLSSIGAQWFGEEQKFVKAIFTLASKLSPCVVFIDEMDSMLGQRKDANENGCTRRTKNEFLVNWDGLKTKSNERVLVLAATNRPFDLDEAVIRRLPRRLMVHLPDAANRVKILKVMLSKEDLDADVDFITLAHMTEGYSGSDLKNMCIGAAHCPVREILEREKEEKEQALAEGRLPPPVDTNVVIRPLNINDFKYAHRQVSASVASQSADMAELIKWNKLYGEGGPKKEKSVCYYN